MGFEYEVWLINVFDWTNDRTLLPRSLFKENVLMGLIFFFFLNSRDDDVGWFYFDYRK